MTQFQCCSFSLCVNSTTNMADDISNPLISFQVPLRFVQNDSKVVDHLETEYVSKSPMCGDVVGFCFTPGAPYSHPLFGKTKQNNQFLFQLSQHPNSSITTECIGHIDKTVSFDSLAGFSFNAVPMLSPCEGLNPGSMPLQTRHWFSSDPNQPEEESQESQKIQIENCTACIQCTRETSDSEFIAPTNSGSLLRDLLNLDNPNVWLFAEDAEVDPKCLIPPISRRQEFSWEDKISDKPPTRVHETAYVKSIRFSSLPPVPSKPSENTPGLLSFRRLGIWPIKKENTKPSCSKDCSLVVSTKYENLRYDHANQEKDEEVDDEDDEDEDEDVKSDTNDGLYVDSENENMESYDGISRTSIKNLSLESEKQSELDRMATTISVFHNIVKLFDQRPVWTKTALNAKLDAKATNDRLKRLLPTAAYYFLNGPWRSCWVRFGYDPRTDPSSRIYQILDFRISKSQLESKSSTKRSTTENCFKTNEKMEDPESLVATSDMDGKNTNNKDELISDEEIPDYDFAGIPNRKQRFYQFCDIKECRVQYLLEIVRPNSFCDPKTGWYSNQMYITVRKLMHETLKCRERGLSDPELNPSYIKSLADFIHRKGANNRSNLECSNPNTQEDSDESYTIPQQRSETARGKSKAVSLSKSARRKQRSVRIGPKVSSQSLLKPFPAMSSGQSAKSFPLFAVLDTNQSKSGIASAITKSSSHGVTIEVVKGDYFDLMPTKKGHTNALVEDWANGQIVDEDIVQEYELLDSDPQEDEE